MSFKTESFEDLTKCSTEKLVKLRDRAGQNALESARAAQQDMQRYQEICSEIDRRARG